ncbi:MAG: CDGSH iron-sulfur domain-containing protein [Euryarchaeota archaeon]|nr:CDGSH iron-sulfur domain-containing protein [Euryarchaeota archaeon]
MTRILTNEQTGPYAVKEGKFPLYICACGLSKNKPYCDGSHKKTRDEQPGVVYKYEGDRRTEVKP